MASLLAGRDGSQCTRSSMIYMGNQSSMSIASNQGYTPCSKHLDHRAHFVRGHVEQGDVKLEYVPSAMQLTDLFTKPLPTPSFVELRQLSGITE